MEIYICLFTIRLFYNCHHSSSIKKTFFSVYLDPRRKIFSFIAFTNYPRRKYSLSPTSIKRQKYFHLLHSPIIHKENIIYIYPALIQRDRYFHSLHSLIMLGIPAISSMKLSHGYCSPRSGLNVSIIDAFVFL